jgi:ferredoxin-NADP reductase/Na+-translocating ferredoxin:NAD+ oxidoreductase RnfD subunit
MMKKIDMFLNKMTMYRAVLYCLIFIFTGSLILSFFGLLPFGPLELAASAAFIMVACILSNAVFAWAFNAPTNIDSVYITALILALIITPAKPFTNLLFLAFVSVVAMASKYMLAVGKKHFFNPAAISVVLVGLIANQSASWWIGSLYILPFVFIGGFLVVRKIKRFDMVLSFFGSALVVNLVFNLVNGQNIFTGFTRALIYSPMFFFAFIMLTEPMSVPHTKILRIIYGALTGVFFIPQIHLGPLYFSPELALVLGNFFTYIVSPDQKLILTLKRKTKLSPDIYDFEFVPDQKIDFKPGQYMEWTVQDSRGIRRYLTISSSPTEGTINLGVKFYQNPSSFKKFLMNIKPDQKIVASQLAGDFVLPGDKTKKLVFIAGGIGITPFRSMIKYLVDKNEKRSIVLLYSSWNISDIAYRADFERAERQLGMKVVYSIANLPDLIPDNINCCGMLSEKEIRREVPDFMERIFYISGPNTMVNAFVKYLLNLGVKRKNIKTDYFPGFA